MLQCYKKLASYYFFAFKKKQKQIIGSEYENKLIYLLPPTITGGLPPSDPGNPGTT